MAGNAKGKLRTLYIMEMLQRETDEEHGLSMADIITRLREMGLTVDRKTVYTDLDTLREFGFVIKTAQRNPVEYYLAVREFSIDELMLMADAIQSCRFITQRQSERIVRNLMLLATEGQREKLSRRIHVDDRVQGRNDVVLANVDTIHEALRLRRRISFTYWKMGVDGKLHAQHDGERYMVTPMRIAFSENRYYLTAWSEQHEAVREYRIDRMRDLATTDKKATRRSEISEHEYQVRDSQYFGRFDGPVTRVTLRVEPDLVPAVWDRFGKDARISSREDGAADVFVTVRVSPQFFGWLAGMNGYVTIERPSALAEEYRSYLQHLLS